MPAATGARAAPGCPPLWSCCWARCWPCSSTRAWPTTSTGPAGSATSAILAGLIWAVGTGRRLAALGGRGPGRRARRRDRPGRRRDRRRHLPRSPHRLPRRPQRRRLLHRRPRRRWRSSSATTAGRVRLAVAVPIVAGLVLTLLAHRPARRRPSPSRGCCWDGAWAPIGGAAVGRRSRVGGRQHPRGPDHLRPLLQPLGQRRPPRADHRPGAGRARRLARGTATVPARPRSTSATWSSSSTTATSPPGRRVAGWPSSSCSACWPSPSSGSAERVARAATCGAAAAQAAIIGVAVMAHHPGRGAARHPDGDRRRLRAGPGAHARRTRGPTDG